jgi:hypothetical protein
LRIWREPAKRPRQKGLMDRAEEAQWFLREPEGWQSRAGKLDSSRGNYPE